MSWTTPITWVDGSVYTATTFNAQIRDNLLVLKTAIGNDGKIIAITSDYFASLSGLNLTGVGLLASANTWSGTNAFGGPFGAASGTVVLPVEGSFGGTDAGDMSVVGTDLSWRNTTPANKKTTGTLQSSPAGAIHGSLWIDSSVTPYTLNYIDNAGAWRSISGVEASVSSNAIWGSLWIDDKLYWIGLKPQVVGGVTIYVPFQYSVAGV